MWKRRSVQESQFRQVNLQKAQLIFFTKQYITGQYISVTVYFTKKIKSHARAQRCVKW